MSHAVYLDIGVDQGGLSEWDLERGCETSPLGLERCSDLTMRLSRAR
jgi:hypothetical protein